jgi:hypothetical protein
LCSQHGTMEGIVSVAQCLRAVGSRLARGRGSASISAGRFLPSG